MSRYTRPSNWFRILGLLGVFCFFPAMAQAGQPAPSPITFEYSAPAKDKLHKKPKEADSPKIMAIFAIVSGVLGFVLIPAISIGAVIFALAAVVLGIIAARQEKKGLGRSGIRAMAIIGAIAGILGMLVWPVVVILLIIALGR